MTSKTGSCDNALEIDKVVVGVGVTAGLSAAAVQRAAGSAGEIAFGSTGIAPPKAASRGSTAGSMMELRKAVTAVSVAASSSPIGAVTDAMGENDRSEPAFHMALQNV